jgi:hypothetical protein
MKLPYEQVDEQADAILMRLLDCGDQAAVYAEYQAFLRTCGWTETEFNAETLRRVDAEYERLLLNHPDQSDPLDMYRINMMGSRTLN